MKLSFILSHLAAAIIVTCIMMCTYASVQQVYRTNANDPQLQMARDISARLNSNRTFHQLLPYNTIEISNSLATFVTLYDKNCEPVQSTGTLNGWLPQIPKGVFDFTKANKKDVITWQPGKGVRMAMVIRSVTSPGIGFIAVGRSLKEVEVRESNLIEMIFITWSVCML